MPPALAQWILMALALYLGLGVLFALPFLKSWIHRLDPVAKASSRGFRVAIFPGVVALWPVLALRLRSGPVQERSPHRAAAQEPSGAGESA